MATILVVCQSKEGIYYENPKVENSDFFVVEYLHHGKWAPVIEAKAYPSVYWVQGSVESICRRIGCDPEDLRIVRLSVEELSKFSKFEPET